MIKDSIKEIIAESGSKGVVLGLSGGIDSSLLLKLASDSGADVYALILPEEGVSGMDDVRDAMELAKDLGVKYSVIKINPILESIEKNFCWDEFSGRNKQIPWGNVKARTRMILNYLVANLDKRIVLGTGNKTEILLGYNTKYGDGGVDIEPLGDLYKTQVKQLAEYLKIPRRIIDKEPSAGLWKGQTDRGELGASYEEIDEILYYLDKQIPLKETMDMKLVEKISEMIVKNKHKRLTPGITGLFNQV